MPNRKVQVGQKSDPFQTANPFQERVSEYLLRRRDTNPCYQIYEFRDRTDNHAAEDWNQAETELMELVGGK